MRLLRKVFACCALTLTTVYGLLGAELGLRWFFVESNGAGATLASQRWLDEYWRPINSLGFRDGEVTADDLAGRRLLWVVGDSYAAGWGIKHPHDRFSDRLAEKLGDGWRVVNIAKPGWDTRRQIEAALAFPHRADAIVHAYCLNDAERAAADAGVRMPHLPTEPSSAILASVIRRSHLANLIYWRWRSWDAQVAAAQYWDFIEKCYAAGPAWDAHESDLQALMQAYRGRTDRIAAFVIPNLLDVESSRPMTAKIEAWFETGGVQCIPLSDHLAGRSPAALVVNRTDPHANEEVHGLIAELLFEAISRMKDSGGTTDVATTRATCGGRS